MRLIDADALETHEIYEGEWVRVVYADDIDNAPTIDAEPVRRGRWEWDYHNGLYYCSECKKKYEYNIVEIMDGEYNYCPNCGAKMEACDAD